MDPTPEIAFSVVRMILEDFRNTLTEIHAEFTIIAEDLSVLANHLQIHFPNLGTIPQMKTKFDTYGISHPLKVHPREAVKDAFSLHDEISRKFKILDQRMQADIRLPWIVILKKLENRGNDIDVKAELLNIDKEVDDLEKLHENLEELISEIPLT